MNRQAKTSAAGFPLLYDTLMWPAERTLVGRWRRRTAARAHGRVLELGAGTGSQFGWYDGGAQVTAVEPDPAMAARARRRAAGARAAIAVVEAHAEALPFEDGAFDVAVASFVLCTVDDPGRAAAELFRVLKPGGVVAVLEHVHLPWQPGRWLQSKAAPAWAALAGGCRLDRDTVATITAAGFRPLGVRNHIVDWIVELVAERPEDDPSAARRIP
jgi:ubiquinone/menaquinone biosynthesis C-methylase UbiE